MTTLRLAVLPFVLLGLVACGGGKSGGGGDDGDGGDNPDGPPGEDARIIDAPADAAPAPPMITVTGAAVQRDANGMSPVAGATIEAYRNSDEATAIATTTTDAQGNFMLKIDTGGFAVDGFLKATKAGFKETYLYPPAPIAADTTAPINMLTPAIFDLLSTFAQHFQNPGMGFVALVVVDGTTAQAMPVAGAVVASTPAASAVRYSNPGTGLPGNAQFTTTHTDGVAYLFNLPGNGVVSVAATKTGSQFKSHLVKAWRDQLTTTLITP